MCETLLLNITSVLFIYINIRLFELCETTRRQCQDIEQEYERFRSKEISTHFHSNISMPVLKQRQRAHSFNLKTVPNSLSTSFVPTSNLFDRPSASVYKSHLRELKSRIQSLTSECITLNEQFSRSEHEKHVLLERITQLERKYRDDYDSLQNELNHCRKLLDKYIQQSRTASHLLTDDCSMPQYNLSLFDEVKLESKPSTLIYEPTNFRALFAPLYEKLKMHTVSTNHRQ
jgi:predicted  nucleic acid-binding Zn-ribbon protein